MQFSTLLLWIVYVHIALYWFLVEVYFQFFCVYCDTPDYILHEQHQLHLPPIILFYLVCHPPAGGWL